MASAPDAAATEPCVRRLTPDDASAYRALMLQAYALHPDAFTSSPQERAGLPLGWWQQRLAAQPAAAEVVFGAFGDGTLVGAVGLAFEAREKARHKAKVTGMVVLEGWRRRGLAAQLLQALMAHARAQPGLQILQLTVTQGNRAAEQLYAGFGFAAFGVEPDAVAVGAGYVAKVHMWRRLNEPPDAIVPA